MQPCLPDSALWGRTHLDLSPIARASAGGRKQRERGESDASIRCSDTRRASFRHGAPFTAQGGGDRDAIRRAGAVTAARRGRLTQLALMTIWYIWYTHGEGTISVTHVVSSR